MTDLPAEAVPVADITANDGTVLDSSGQVIGTTAGVTFRLYPDEAQEALAQVQTLAGVFGRELTASMKAMQPGLEACGRSLLAAFGVIDWAALNLLLHKLTLPRSHRRRCVLCNPWGNPPPSRGHYKPGPKAARIRRRKR